MFKGKVIKTCETQLYVWLGSVVARALDLRSTSRGLILSATARLAPTLGKSFTQVSSTIEAITVRC